jgi:hypothetical protein
LPALLPLKHIKRRVNVPPFLPVGRIFKQARVPFHIRTCSYIHIFVFEHLEMKVNTIGEEVSSKFHPEKYFSP